MLERLKTADCHPELLSGFEVLSAQCEHIFHPTDDFCALVDNALIDCSLQSCIRSALGAQQGCRRDHHPIEYKVSRWRAIKQTHRFQQDARRIAGQQKNRESLGVARLSRATRHYQQPVALRGADHHTLAPIQDIIVTPTLRSCGHPCNVSSGFGLTASHRDQCLARTNCR
ncbi:hypothetical protein D3C80_1690510 [compost metagenome]